MSAQTWFTKFCSWVIALEWIVALGLILLVTTIPSLAQAPTGTILGVVKDASGGTVPGAEITILNTETTQTRTAKTGDDGAFRVPALPVGHYTVKIEKEGFKTETQTGLVLDVSQELVVNVSMQIGTSSQEVVVTGEAPLVNTSTSSLGGLVNEEKMADLPLNGRNYIDLSLMQAGISQNKFNVGQDTPGVWFSSNGAPIRSNNFTLDGAPMNSLAGGAASSAAGTTLGVDGIREYKVVTNAFSAEYGLTMGSQMIIVSKGGSNRWSGDVFEYLRNSAMDARNFFDYGYLTSGAPRLPEFQRNNFGGAFGGPIKKDKTFFFAVYEGLRQNLGFTATDTVPPAACHNISSNGSNYQFNTNADATNCATGLVGPGGSGTPTVIPAVMAPLLGLFPSPILANNVFTYPTTSTARVDYGQIRVDQNFSAADSFFGRYTIDDTAVSNANLSIVPASTGVSFPQLRESGTTRNQFLSLSESHIFSTTLLNTARVSFSRPSLDVGPQYLVPLNGPQYSFVGNGVPIGGLSITGISGFGPSTSTGPPDLVTIQDVYSFSDDLYYTKGKHGLKFGVLINHYDDGVTQPFVTAGTLSFSNLANFMTGIPNTYAAATPGSNFNRNYVFNTIGLYAQDDWRATSRLTMNLGLRYEFETVPTETNGRGYAFRNIQTDKQGTQGPLFKNYTLRNFSPRVGFAYDLFGKGKTSIRGAFGVFYDVGNLGALFLQNTYGTPPVSNRNSVTNTTGAVISLPFVWPTGSVGSSPLTSDYNISQPHTLQYNLTVEQQLPGGIGLSVSYVGLRGIHIWTAKDGNPTPPTSVTNGVQFWAASLTSCQNIVPSCRINTNLASVFFITSGADSWYNGLQVVLNKRLGRGLEFQSAYTYSKAIDTTQAYQGNNDCFAAGGNSVGYDPLYPKYDRAPGCMDVQNNWRFNMLYHFPNINSDNFTAKLLHGWWVGNIVSVQSGYPFTPILATNRSRDGTLGTQADRVNLVTATVAPGQVSPDGYTNTTAVTFVPYNPNTVITGNPRQWYNPYMFTLGPVGYLGNASRDMLRGPGLGEWDFSVVKDTALPFLGEKGAVQFRAEFFNFLNRANFGPPNGTVFTGTASHLPYSEVSAGITSTNPIGSAGQITTTSTASRQIQLALKLVF